MHRPLALHLLKIMVIECLLCENEKAEQLLCLKTQVEPLIFSVFINRKL